MHGYEEFKEKFYRKTKIDLSLYKEKQMKRRIESLITRHKCKDFIEFFKKMEQEKAVFDEFINFMTINVSEFYRNPEQWEVMKKIVIPKLMQNKKRLNVWSAACSTGEEPYTLVMVLSEFMPLKDIKILAADIDLEAMAKAKAGVYSEKSLANLPKHFISKYFTKIGNSYQISDDVKKCVQFKQMNLLNDIYPKGMDLICCRNVMIYFTDEAKEEMYKKFNGALVEGGVFFVGSTEQIISPEKYNFKTLKTFFYEK